ncbi:hypothetical protein AVEN_54514-1 [Araneus ventricosus]|uniref:Uncharacterized protein n=1 Tax=Araneus ventricosus TaxID=182803 RepID=A0A4Y2EL58_ARAVE|nr:hypothetical protein AVEN_54514-1 [Araneus ventricosus]
MGTQLSLPFWLTKRICPERTEYCRNSRLPCNSALALANVVLLLWQATIFYEYEDTEKEKIELLEYFKSRGQEIAEDDGFEVLHCDDNAPTVCQLTDAEICSMVLMNSKTSVSESEGETQVEDKITIDISGSVEHRNKWT